MENVKTYAWDITLENDSLIVEEGAILGVTAGNTNTIGYNGTLSVYGTLQGATVKDFGYIGVGVAGEANFVDVQANGTFEVWAAAESTNADVSGFDAANTGNMYVLAGAEAVGTDVNAFGQLHVAGIAEGTRVNANGYMGIGDGGIAYDSFVGFNGSADVFAGGIADDITVAAGGDLEAFAGAVVNEANIFGVATAWAGSFFDDAYVGLGGQLRVAGDAIVDDAEIDGDLTLYSGAVVTGDVEVNGSINTWGVACTENAVFELEFDRTADILDKARIDDLGNLNGAVLSVEVDSSLDEGRYLIAGNAEFAYGKKIYFTDGDIVEGWVTIGDEGAYVNNKTYCFNIDANDNLYLDVYDGTVAEIDYASSNTLGAGDFNGDGNAQQIWYNALTNSMVIEGIAGEIACMGDFAGVGDFNGDNFADILFTSGDTVNVMYFGNVGGNIGILTGINYGEVLGGGTVDNFQIGNFDNNPLTDEIYVKRAEGFYDVATLVADDNGDFVPEFKIIGSTTCVMD